MYATATFAFVLVMFSILLIYAARCRRHQLVLPWLIVQLLERCFIAVFIAVGLVRHALGVVPIILILFALSKLALFCCSRFRVKNRNN
jgi:hypothetical protein